MAAHRVFKNVFLTVGLLAASVSQSFAQSASGTTAFKQSLIQAVGKDKDIINFYKATDFRPIWTDGSNASKKRRQALIAAFKLSSAHGLPSAKFNPAVVQSNLSSAKTSAELGKLEGQLSSMFLQYARSIQTGVLVPSKVDAEIVRKVPYRGRFGTLVAFSKSSPSAFMQALPPKTPEYARLLKEKLRLERLVAKGGWGAQVSAKKLEPGATGDAVVALRNRLIAMEFLGRTTSATYDENMTVAVQQFQLAHGLSTDGVAGAGTLDQINVTAQRRLTSVVVAMERERWLNRPLGQRHVWVNLTDYHARIIDDGKVSFQTRSVIGASKEDRRSPEFSDVLEFMVINPSWYVPRSITTKEYLPLLQRNANAVKHLEMRNARGKAISRSGVDFNQYTEDTFPYSFRQPPSRGNALGLVKFMFPNKYNIYLHDTPAKKAICP